ncbi:thioredoxin family protein [Pseudomonas sp. NPDC089734]|uniref:thioredoxin family protein n=1 Tax=Pseudomonas sp. NPDC089734 TaxID=3364469 RepID=UPI00380B6BF5
MSVMNVDDDAFQDQVFTTNLLVLAEFSGPGINENGDPDSSALTNRIVDDLAVEYDGRVLMLRVHKDSSEATAENFGVDSVPSVIFFKNGAEVSRTTGFHDKDWYRQEIDRLLRS